MGPIELLMDEHRLIEKVIDALFGYAQAMPSAADDAKEDLSSFVAFIRGFADAHHHGKEEDILFQAMTDAGMPDDVGPLAVMLQEHDEGRGYTKTLAEEAEGEMSEEDRREVAWAAKCYGNLLRAHILKEDEVLYPMADQMLPEPVWQSIEASFTAFEDDPAHQARAAKLKASAAALIAKYAPGA